MGVGVWGVGGALAGHQERGLGCEPFALPVRHPEHPAVLSLLSPPLERMLGALFQVFVSTRKCRTALGAGGQVWPAGSRFPASCRGQSQLYSLSFCSSFPMWAH